MQPLFQSVVFESKNLRIMKQLKLTAAFVLALIATTIFAQKKIEREFSDIEDIKLTTASGDCFVKKSNDSTVKLTLEYTYDEDDYEPIIEQDGSKLMLKEDFKSRSVSGKVTWTLHVPDNIDFKLNSGSGDLSIADVMIEIDMNTGSGDLEVSSVKGEVDANTGSGDIKMSNFDGSFKGNTGSGNVKVNGGKGEVKVNCGSGEISMSDVSGLIAANVGSGDIDVTNITVTDKSYFNSGSGDVRLELAASPAANLSVNSGSGDAIVDFNGNALVGTVVMKADKRKGEIKAPIKFDKEEEVKEGSQTYIKKTAKLSDADIKISIGTGSGTAGLKE